MVEGPGRTSEKVSRALTDLEDEDMAVACVDLPLDESATPAATEPLGKNCFVFAGLMVRFYHVHDHLRLQRPLVERDQRIPTSPRVRDHAFWTTSLRPHPSRRRPQRDPKLLTVRHVKDQQNAAAARIDLSPARLVDAEAIMMLFRLQQRGNRFRLVDPPDIFSEVPEVIKPDGGFALNRLVGRRRA